MKQRWMLIAGSLVLCGCDSGGGGGVSPCETIITGAFYGILPDTLTDAFCECIEACAEGPGKAHVERCIEQCLEPEYITAFERRMRAFEAIDREWRELVEAAE